MLVDYFWSDEERVKRMEFSPSYRPDHFAGHDLFEHEMGQLAAECTPSAVVPGQDPVRVPLGRAPALKRDKSRPAFDVRTLLSRWSSPSLNHCNAHSRCPYPPVDRLTREAFAKSNKPYARRIVP